ncbi:uncharacterized protein LOC132298606 [Cornus florida]|uniref:uncharacterized protein LOC132298606 n=1 Tax=Cornus florida TaxID=4283 RepID=UPI00289CE21C|nr:uncharacterized protein LOC132298606 [Cornus florida]
MSRTTEKMTVSFTLCKIGFRNSKAIVILKALSSFHVNGVFRCWRDGVSVGIVDDKGRTWYAEFNAQGLESYDFYFEGEASANLQQLLKVLEKQEDAEVFLKQRTISVVKNKETLWAQNYVTKTVPFEQVPNVYARAVGIKAPLLNPFRGDGGMV